MTLPGTGQLVLTQKDYFQEVGKAIDDVPLATWKDYLTLRTIDAYSPYLSKAFVDENFDFYQRTLSGTPQIKPRWKRALGELEGSTGDLLGKEYVKRHFPPEAKQRMDELVGNLLKAFDVSIDELAWMGPETKQGRARQGPQLHGQDRLPDQVEGLHRPGHAARTTCSATCCARVK